EHQQGALAASARPHDRYELARRDGKVDFGQCLNLAPRAHVTFSRTGDLDRNPGARFRRGLANRRVHLRPYSTSSVATRAHASPTRSIPAITLDRSTTNSETTTTAPAKTEGTSRTSAMSCS